MIRRWCIFFLTVLLAGPLLNAQEVITGTFRNPKLDTTIKRYHQEGLKSSLLTLPFYDDFSSGDAIPESSLWEDNYVFINNTFCENQLTQGIATFDALDETGALYEGAAYYVFAADTLTSLPIDLALNASDSIYLSFLYEPGGLADMPETNDSLTLEFYSPSEAKWQSVWRAKGSGKPLFNRTMLRIIDPKFLEAGFRFRFTNYASLASASDEPARAGNADIWNIDCVILDKGRTMADTVMYDVAYTTPVRSLLNNMEAMPWNQFKKARLTAMGSTLSIDFRNNDTASFNPRNVTPKYSITDIYRDTVSKEIEGRARNLEPLSDNIFEEELLYTYKSSTPDSALFLIKATLTTDPSDPKENDTIEYYQFFGDYFAYDDGTAEAGYGINGEGSDNAMVALRYRSFIGDSVAGIRVCFNDAVSNANQRYFYMVLLADDDGKPGEIIATSEEMLAMPSELNNGFREYLFDKPLFVDSYFWVGWRQVSETFLNVGLDVNTPHQDRLWYWINGNWYASSAPGTILLRAVMKGDGLASSSDDNNSLYDSRFSIFPNPVNESFSVLGPANSNEEYKLEICNLHGSVIMTTENHTDINISHLPAGIYFVVIKSKETKPLQVLKLIKTS